MVINVEYWEASKDFKQGKSIVTVTVKGKSKKDVSDFLKEHKLLIGKD